MDLSDILKAYNGLDETKQADVLKDAMSLVAGRFFVPNPGPQTDAYYSEADEIFYGGGAGGGKSFLLCGVAIQDHSRSLVLRRVSKHLSGLKNEIAGLLGGRDGLNDTTGVWKLPTGGVIELGHCQHERNKEDYQGNPHDLIGFDEITQFSESQYRYIIGWNRTTKEGQRCRVISTGNPPINESGLWVIRYWAPWLDPAHPNPAQPGELRYFLSQDGEDVEVDGPGPHEVDWSDVPVIARSRTFIPALLEDNPDLMATGYASVLNSMPEELRERLRHGKFNVETQDDAWQVIPKKWIEAAQARWTDRPPEGMEMTAVAVDVAQGGKDKTQIQSRYDWWYGRFSSFKGKDTPDGPSIVREVVPLMRDRCRVIVDAGGGYGGDALTQMAHADIDCFGFLGSTGSTSRSRDGLYGFKNFRSQVVWQFREALDPAFGSQIALPPDPELTADLCAYRYEPKPAAQGFDLQAGPKEDMREMLGRSPDKGDTTLMLFASHAAGLRRPKAARDRRSNRHKMPRVALTATGKTKSHGRKL